MPQQILNTERITLVPLADGHLAWEAELDSDPEVMRYLGGRASTRQEVESSQTRMAAPTVDGVWVGLVDDEFVGWWDPSPHMASARARDLRIGADALRLRGHRARPDHRPDVDRQRRLAGRHEAGRSDLRADLPTSMTGPVEGVGQGEVEFEMTRKQWERSR